MTAGFSASTRGQYEMHLHKFQEFCVRNNHTSFPVITCRLGIDFLAEMFSAGLSYSSINSARSAISQLTTLSDSPHSFGSHPHTSRFLKGVFYLRPPRPRYDSTWDVKPVLAHVAHLETDCLKNLTLKCVFLLAIVTGQRVQSLAALDIQYMIKSSDKISFMIQKPLKTSKPGKSQRADIHKFSDASRADICPMLCTLKYLEATRHLRDSNSLFISYSRPHKPVGAQTISRWISHVLNEAGIDTKYGAHSVRHASSSKAAALRVPIDRILQTVGWTNEQVFAKFYRRTIAGSEKSFAEAVLSSRDHAE